MFSEFDYSLRGEMKQIIKINLYIMVTNNELKEK